MLEHYLSTPSAMLVATAFTAGFVWMTTPLARRLGLLDVPNDRKQHEHQTPLVGGLSIYFALILATVYSQPPSEFLWIVGASALLIIVGLIDDAFDLSVKTRLLAQFFAAIVPLAGASTWITDLGGIVPDYSAIQPTLGIPLTILAVVGLTNSFNMADGIDGLCTGYALVTLGMLAIASLLNNGYIPEAEWLLLFATILATFLLINISATPLAKVFLGDSGSLLIGFMISWLIIIYTQKLPQSINPVVALWFVTLPIFDTAYVILARIKNGRSPFHPDRGHIHHKLVDSGMSHVKSTVVLITTAIVLASLGLAIEHWFNATASLAIYFLVMAVYMYAVTKSAIKSKQHNR